jgi:hypothetical protein
MTGDDDGDDGRPDEVPLAETLDEVLASDDSGLCAGLLDLLALLSDVGAARWLLHKAGDLGLVAAPGGYGVHEAFAPGVIDAALEEMAEAGLVTIDEAVFDDAGDDDAGDDDVGDPDDPDDSDPDDPDGEGDDQDENDLDELAFDVVTVVPDAARIILARHVAAGTIAGLGDRAGGLLEEAARSGAIDSVLLTDGITACWDHLRPCLGPADDELVRDLLAMRNSGLYALTFYPGVTAAGLTGFGEKLVADYEQALGPGHPDAWEARRNMAGAYGRCRRYDDAIGVFTRLLADMERVLPADDGEILWARSDLALAHMNAGRYPEAVWQYTQLAADYERAMGPRHQLTLHARGQLGEAYLEVGRIAEGTGLMEAVAAGLEATAGPDYPEVVRLRAAIDEARGQ